MQQQGFFPLALPVPPMFEEALGYSSHWQRPEQPQARYVAFYWTERGSMRQRLPMDELELITSLHETKDERGRSSAFGGRSMVTKVHQPELAVGEIIPDGFTGLRGASNLVYRDGIGLKYRRHFWYVTKHTNGTHLDIVKHVCTSYQEAVGQYQKMVDEQEVSDLVPEEAISFDPTSVKQGEKIPSGEPILKTDA